MSNSYERCGADGVLAPNRYSGTGMATWPTDGKTGLTAKTYDDVKTNVTCTSAQVTNLDCPSLTVTSGGCVSANWTGTGTTATVDIASGECLDLKYTPTGNDDNGFYFMCSNKAALGSQGSSCYRQLSVDGKTYEKSGSCNESLNNNTGVAFNLTGQCKTCSGTSFEKEGITIEAFTATEGSPECLPALPTGQRYAENISGSINGQARSLCNGGVVKLINYTCSSAWDQDNSNFFGYSSICPNGSSNITVTEHECVSTPGATSIASCSSGYGVKKYSNKTTIDVDFTCKIKANNNNWQ